MHIAPDTIVDGRYRVLKRLGTGGMAEVWCAEDEVLGRRVALKLLGSRYAEDPEFRERFRREARAAAGPHAPEHRRHLRPRGVGRHAVHRDGAGRRAHAQGARASSAARCRPTSPIDLTEQLLRALGYAHKRGIVHRDVKPQNVIIDGEGQAKVADFGIARAANSEMTETGAIVGTVQYLSPEQAQGQPVDPRSDLYSAGVVLYELLTGPRAVRRRGAGLDRAQARLRAAGAARRSCGPGIPPALEARRPARAREGPGVPLPERRGVHRGARERAPRADAPGRARAGAVAERGALALVAVGARAARGGRDRASARGSCSPATA